MSVYVRPIDSQRFDAMEPEWEALRCATAADPLFMSWWWQHSWWKTFGAGLGARLLLLGVYRESGELMALAPLYSTRQRRYGMGFTRVEFLGNHWRDRGNIRTEYVSMITRAREAAEAACAVVDYLAETVRPGEIVLTNHVVDSPVTTAWLAAGAARGARVRVQELGQTHCVQPTGSFRGYLDALGAKTRGKLFNHRKRLLERGAVLRQRPLDADELIDNLNAFHMRRWGKAVFSGGRRRFHERAIAAAAARDCLSAEVLQVDGRPISVLYDFLVDRVRYGYQLGFDQDFDRRLSPASLHLGYAIEDAFESSLERYDFLRGAGKSGAFYKDRITSPLTWTATHQLILDWRLKSLYGVYDRMHAGTGRFRQGGSRAATAARS